MIVHRPTYHFGQQIYLHGRILYSDSALVQRGALSRPYLQVANNPFKNLKGTSDMIERLLTEFDTSKLLHERTLATLKAEFERKCIDLELENNRHLQGLQEDLEVVH